MSGVLLLIICAGLDICTLITFKTAFPRFYRRHSKIFLSAYFLVHVVFIAGLFYSYRNPSERWVRTAALVGVFMFYSSKIFVAIFYLGDEMRRGFVYLRKKVWQRTASQESTLSRSQFLARSGLAVASVPFLSLNFGLITGPYDFRVRKVTLFLPNLPGAFDGMTIGQISDIHAGSFNQPRKVPSGIDLLLQQKPDIIFFTGDLVNDRATEMRNYQDVFARLKAPLGVFSVFGNHDYGDYVQWPSAAAKQKNIDDIKTIHRLMGFNLLTNRHQAITVDGNRIAILGVENWGALSHFPKHGRVDLAIRDTEDYPVKLLLSHDPSHWRAQIIPKYPSIDVMFSGHTHGMQMGLRLPHFQWSPIQYIYPEWAGLYHEGAQQLYVNVGYGFLGYPGRIGMDPEITLFTLKRGGDKG